MKYVKYMACQVVVCFKKKNKEGKELGSFGQNLLNLDSLDFYIWKYENYL